MCSSTSRRAPHAAVVLSCFLVSGCFENDERKEMEKRLERLDATLVQKRTIARNLERFRIEVARIDERRTEARHLMSPDFDALDAALPDGVTMRRGKWVVQGFYQRRKLVLSGDLATFEPALATLADTIHVLDVPRIALRAADWSIDVTAYEFVERTHTRSGRSDDRRSPPAPVRLDGKNGDLRWAIATKQAKLRKLDNVIGDVGEYVVKKKELEERLNIIDRLVERSSDVPAVVRPLVVGAERPFLVIDARHDGDAIRVLAGPGAPSRGDIQLLLPVGWEIRRFEASGDGVSFDIRH